MNKYKLPKLKPEYTELVDSIIKDLENNIIPWRKPWFSKLPVNFKTKKQYRGINILLLLSAAHKKGFESHYWLTANQAFHLGGKIKSIEVNKNSNIILAKWKHKIVKDERGRPQKKMWLMMRSHKIYNLEQTTGVRNKYYDGNTLSLFNINQQAEDVIKSYRNPPVFSYSPDRAYYMPCLDLIGIPKLDQFYSPEEYYSTYFHELIHSTGHKKRLNRSLFAKVIKFGDEEYAKEELVAELGAAFLSSHCDFFSKTCKNSGAYLKSWLKVLKSDKTFLLSATKHAQFACDYIIEGKPQEQEDVKDEEEQKGLKDVKFTQDIVFK
ncbi:MAG: DUF1738 domain-containing protein [Ignavibacteriae bacterium]|nr:MAG: DUF1738 domain-containing protein [Ignavibacteriota bacterium]